jgi:LysR family glycine cleavage system transcriptional activator
MARRIPSLNALRAFEAAGRHGQMTLAAGELHVTHSAVSRQVKHLEALLGVQLFEGPKNALRLTEAGRMLLPGLTAAFDQIDVAVRLVADMEEGPLDVSCLGTFSMRWLIPRLYRFKTAQRAIEVRLTASDSPVDLARDGFDVAIRVGAGPWPDGAEVVHLLAEHVGPVLAPPLAQSAPRDFSGIPLLHTRTRPRAWADWCGRTGVAVRALSETEYEHFYFMLEAATAGLGVCIAPWPLVADDILAGRLVAPHGFVESGQDYVALRRKRPHRKSALFCEWLRAEADLFAVKHPVG